MPTARVQEADCSRFVPRLALVFPLRAFFGLYSSCSFLFISIYYLLSSSSCSIFIYFGSSFVFSFVFSSLLGSRSARLCALFCVRRPFGLLFFLDSSRIPPQTSLQLPNRLKFKRLVFFLKPLDLMTGKWLNTFEVYLNP